jgi:hypothetical protein
MGELQSLQGLTNAGLRLPELYKGAYRKSFLPCMLTMSARQQSVD